MRQSCLKWCLRCINTGFGSLLESLSLEGGGVRFPVKKSLSKNPSKLEALTLERKRLIAKELEEIKIKLQYTARFGFILKLITF